MRQLYRFRTPSSGREVLLEAEEDKIYVDHSNAETMEVSGKVVPLAPSKSQLPWSIENLRFCDHCDQLTQKDLNDCSHCHRRMAAIER